MPKRTRDRQLAKLAARRQAERKAARRRRTLVIGAVAGVLALILVVAAGALLFSDSQPDSSAATTPPATASASTAGTCDPTPPAGAGEAKPTFDEPVDQKLDPNATTIATMVTSCGVIEMELLPKVAPEGVNNFVFLATEGYYDGLTFHRIVKDFVIQGGDPDGTGGGGPGYEFDIETSEKQTFDSAGLVAYANSGPGTNGSQFFITLAPLPSLDPGPNGEYTIFAKVTDGQDVVDEIAAVPTVAGPGCVAGETCSPTQPVYIASVTISQA
jgi:cyclophilin family peptidyl-prolyl cis-trans isomerase